jgi:ubiquinone/menaquinone biosynthesis C-methylase UbiE
MMTQQREHDFLISGTHDDYNRQSFIQNMRMHILQDVSSGMEEVYEHRVKPAMVKQNGAEPDDGRDICKAMMKDPYGKTWAAMIHTCQEMIWESVGAGIERQQPHLNERVRGLNSRLGSVTLNPDLELPRYTTASDIHVMPGNYHTERQQDDVSQGALFDRGLYVFQSGFAGEDCDSNGRTGAELVKRAWPDFKPKKILDLGCTVGNNTMPYADVFPDAELHAIDVAAPCVRYGHARAEALGKAAHFHQMDAEHLDFEDNSFDLVVSCILFHETSRKAVGNILREAHRVLKTGGLMMHLETPRASEMTPYQSFRLDWDTYYNNEPFLSTWMRTDMKEASTNAGFAEDKYESYVVPDFYCVTEEDFEEAINSQDKADSTAVHWGEAVQWSFYGAWK